ncbi:helix-turn-helix domain-containing protein [Roseibium sp. TrichSKD4]|uniref:helix-turn-helix domain-containing protein n=1 Tax=Roseibium sp. TrichSKD4 TaxID=744980 RepID=UPI001112B83F|nr:helix-turn-helix transcriptional regulator [Roseibium sp. TrichSKD4]
MILTGNNLVMPKSPISLAKSLTGLTGEKLAEKLGVSATHLSRMGSNKRRITTEHIEKLAEISGKSVDEFYSLLGTHPADILEAQEALSGHSANDALLIDPNLFKKAYERARAIEQTMLGGRGSNADFAIILEQAYSDIAAQHAPVTEED